MNIFDMNKNSLPEQVQINKENIKRLMDNASINSFALRVALAVSFSESNTYNAGDLVWHNDGTVDMPSYYLYKANQAVSAGIWDETQWDVVKLKDLLYEKQNVLTFDDTPTENSDNPVKSDGIYQAINTINNRINATELWRNPDITQNFAAQTITIANKENFAYLIFIFAANNQSGDNQREQYITKMINFDNEQFAVRLYNTNGTNIHYRYALIPNNTSVQFNDATSGGTTDNTRIIPVAIYGTNILS